MGADGTASQLIFFIAATLVAAAASAALSGVVLNLAGKMDEKGKALGDVLTTDVRIVNDPVLVPNNPVIIYVKNTGEKTLNATLATLLIDGNLVSTTKTIVGGAAGAYVWRPADVLQLSYSATLANTDDHQARVITENGVHDDMRFRVP